jgi:hypothetical protein
MKTLNTHTKKKPSKTKFKIGYLIVKDDIKINE